MENKWSLLGQTSDVASQRFDERLFVRFITKYNLKYIVCWVSISLLKVKQQVKSQIKFGI